MNTKVIPAYEAESSVTIRLTPTDIAGVLHKCNLDDLKEVISVYTATTKLYSPDIVATARWDIIKGVGA